ncbi:MAG TPA: hypothetical protein IGS52_15060 [Oscillatoriaceae cyanobacterium M33_DOE_052]|nr:hypothetical protein [Oscillatoriaceae cyanobacterium M33_DOE_052]
METPSSTQLYNSSKFRRADRVAGFDSHGQHPASSNGSDPTACGGC